MSGLRLLAGPDLASGPEGFADQERGPTEVGASVPVVLVEAGLSVATATQLACRHLLIEEPRSRLAEELLVGRQVRHDRATVFQY